MTNAAFDGETLVYVIDDDPQIRGAVVDLCRSMRLEALAFSSTEEFINSDIASKPCCLVLDIRFTGMQVSGLQFQRDLIARGNRIPIVFLSGHTDVRASVEAMKNGAVEFLLKPFREQELLDAIRVGIERDRNRRDQEAFLSQLKARFESLTPREQDLARLVARGFVGKQIASELRISEVTVKVHRARVMQKLQVQSIAELTRIVDRLGATGAAPSAVDDRRSGLVKAG
jgi:FixJ family two-component response regulator